MGWHSTCIFRVGFSVVFIAMLVPPLAAQAPSPTQSPADQPTPRQLAEQRRDEEALARHQATLGQLQRAVAEARRLLREDKHREAYPILLECRRRLGRTPDAAIQALLGEVALREDSGRQALQFIEVIPSLANAFKTAEAQGHYDPALFEGYRVAAEARLMLARDLSTNPSTNTRTHQAQPQGRSPQGPNRPSFFGIPIDDDSAKPTLTDQARTHAREALVLFDWLAGHERWLNQILAAEGCAKALVLTGDYRQAIQAYEFAIHNARHSEGVAGQLTSDELAALLRRLRQALDQVRRLHDIERYSEEFVLFREAERLRRDANRPAEAAARYRQCIEVAQANFRKMLAEAMTEAAALAGPGEASTDEAKPRAAALEESPFAAASRFYHSLCLIEMGKPEQIAQAVRDLQQFVERDPGTRAILLQHRAASRARPGAGMGMGMGGPGAGASDRAGESTNEPVAAPPAPPPGLYRGEALLELGRIALERELNLNLAGDYFAWLDAWIAAVRQEEQGWNFNHLLPGIRAAAKRLTDGPKDEKFTDFWGNIKKTRIQPGMLVNRKTTPWYLDDLEEHAAKMHGFLLLVQGNGEKAREAFFRAMALDPHERAALAAGIPCDFSRLAFGAKHGHLTLQRTLCFLVAA